MKTMFKKTGLALSLIVPLIAVTSRLSAQSMSSIKADYMNMPLKVNGKDASIQQAGADVTFPVFKKFKDGKMDFLLVDVGYKATFVSGIDFIPSKFHTANMTFIYQKSFTPNIALNIIAAPGLSSDFKDLSADALNYVVGAAVKFNQTKDFKYSFGVVYMDQFIGRTVAPWATMDWTINKKLSLTFGFPTTQIKYQLTPRDAFAIEAAGDGGAFRLSKKENSRYVEMFSPNAGITYERKVGSKLSFTLRAAHTFTQRVGLYEKDQKIDGFADFEKLDKRPSVEKINQNGFIFKTGLSYHF